jgi:hypothetical protein
VTRADSARLLLHRNDPEQPGSSVERLTETVKALHLANADSANIEWP